MCHFLVLRKEVILLAILRIFFRLATVHEYLLSNIDIPLTATLQQTGDLVTSDNLLIHLAKHMWFLSQKGEAELNKCEY